MTAKPDPIGSPASLAVIETTSAPSAGLFDFGAPAGARKRMFQFAKPKRKPALGPARSAYGCD